MSSKLLKVLSIMLITCMSLILFGCGGDEKGSKGSSSNRTSQNGPGLASEALLTREALAVFAPIARHNELSEEKLRKCVKLLGELGLRREQIKYVDEHIYITPPYGKKLGFDRLFLYFNRDKDLVEASLTSCDYGSTSRDSIMMMLYHQKKGIIHKIDDIYITLDQMEKMRKNALKKLTKDYFTKEAKDIKLVDDACAPVIQEDIWHKISDHKKLPVKYAYYAKYAYRLDLFDGAKEKNEFISLLFDEDLEVVGPYKGEPLFTVYVSAPVTYKSIVHSEKYDIFNNNKSELERQLESEKEKSKPKSAKSEPSTNVKNSSGVPPVSERLIASASHSSADVEGNGYIHSADLTLDRNIKTCWSEGIPGHGIGESITINFDEICKVSGINIWTGHQKTEDLFYKNNRPTKIRIVGSDGSSEVYNLNDAMGKQIIRLASPISVNSIKIIIEEVAKGNKYQDTCIAEVEFF